MEISFGGGGGVNAKEEFSWDCEFKPGWQTAEVLWAGEHTSAAGNACVKLILGLPEHAGSRRKTSYYVSANDAGGRLTNLFESTGLAGVIQGGGGHFEPMDLKGRFVLARIASAKGFNGGTDAKVEWLQANDASKVEPTVARANEPVAAVTEDEIPF